MKLNRLNFCSVLFVLSLFSVSLFYACGGDDPLNATVEPKSGETTSSDQTITISFNKPMDKTATTLSGNISDDSDGGTWSADNKTLTLKPAISWNAGTAATLKVDSKDTGGTAIGTLDVSYDLNLAVSKFQKAKVVIGQSLFTLNSSNQGGAVAANTINDPYGNPTTVGGKLILPDYSNNRILIF